MALLDKKKAREQDLEAYLYASDKARLINMVCKMGNLASEALEGALKALRAFDLPLAQSVID